MELASFGQLQLLFVVKSAKHVDTIELISEAINSAGAPTKTLASFEK